MTTPTMLDLRSARERIAVDDSAIWLPEPGRRDGDRTRGSGASMRLQDAFMGVGAARAAGALTRIVQ